MTGAAGLNVERWRRRPVEFDAVRLTGETDWEAVAAWCGGSLEQRVDGPGADPYTVLVVHPLDVATMGEWVVRAPWGLFSSVADEAWRRWNEPAADEQADTPDGITARLAAAERYGAVKALRYAASWIEAEYLLAPAPSLLRNMAIRVESGEATL